MHWIKSADKWWFKNVACNGLLPWYDAVFSAVVIPLRYVTGSHASIEAPRASDVESGLYWCIRTVRYRRVGGRRSIKSSLSHNGHHLPRQVWASRHTRREFVAKSACAVTERCNLSLFLVLGSWHRACISSRISSIVISRIALTFRLIHFPVFNEQAIYYGCR
jgi:hypothetical protein